MTKKIVYLSLFLSLFSPSFYPCRVWAKELKTTCSDSSCQPATEDGFFSLDNLSPGQTYSFQLRFVNNSSDKENIYFSLSPESANPQGGIEFILKDGDLVLYDGYLTKKEVLNLGNLESRQTKDFWLFLRTPANLDDSWQGKSFKFDSNLNFEIGSSNSSSSVGTGASATPTPTPTPTPTKIRTSHQRKSNSGLGISTAFKDKLPSNFHPGQVLGAKSDQDILAASTTKIKNHFIPWIKAHPIHSIVVISLLGLITTALRVVWKRKRG